MLFASIDSLSVNNCACMFYGAVTCNGRRTDRKNAKNVYHVIEVVSVAVKSVAEVVRSSFVMYK